MSGLNNFLMELKKQDEKESTTESTKNTIPTNSKVEEVKTSTVKESVKEPKKETRHKLSIKMKTETRTETNIQEENTNTHIPEEKVNINAPEDSVEDMFIKSETPESRRKDWFETYENAIKSKKNNYIIEKIRRGKFSITSEGTQIILPELDTYGKSSQELLGENWLKK